MLRVRRDHTCISLQLFRDEENDLCQKCYQYRQRQKGIDRKLKKDTVPKCERPWFYDIDGFVENRFITKKKND